MVDILEERRIVLFRRYRTDEVFRVTVDEISYGGYADDDGIFHVGPTLADAEKADKILRAQREAVLHGLRRG
jgi:hypothetical protein